MAASAADIVRLRRMVAEPTTTTYSDAILTEIIERYPLLDADGLAWDDDDWVAVYDANASAAEVWAEKAAALTGSFDFAADGASFTRSQAYAQAAKQQRYYAARRAPGTITMVRPAETDVLETEDVAP
jgi:hypothetical protein